MERNSGRRESNFKGSKAVGCRINERAAKIAKGQKWIKRVVAEMGGKNAIIVDSSANIKKAAQGVASSAFTFQGQRCSACSRAIVLSDVYDEFAEAVIKANSFDEALDIANQTEYGLTGSVYSEDRENIQKAKVEFQVGNLYFNRKSTAAVVLQHPVGGFNMSGTDAKTGTADYLTNFLNLKSVTEDLTD